MSKGTGAIRVGDASHRPSDDVVARAHLQCSKDAPDPGALPQPREFLGAAVIQIGRRMRRHAKQVRGAGMEPLERPIRLAIVDDYAVVIAGVASFLADERIDVVETGASVHVVSDVDIVLYDTFGQVTGDGVDLEDYVRDSGAKVVVYSWNLEPALIQRAMDL